MTTENTMKYTQLTPDIKVSRICLGMMSYGDPKWRPWVLPLDEAIPFIKRAIELGINFFDTADFYSAGVSEQVLGDSLIHLNIQRSDVVIATKVGLPVGDAKGLSRKHIMNSIENSLKYLKLDYVDLYQIHRWDYDTPIEETMEALHDLVKAGKVKYIGASSMFAWQFAKAQSIAERNGWTKFVTMQDHYNLIYREEEREMIPMCNDQGVRILPYSPLARGLLSGNHSRDTKSDSTRGQSDDITTRMYTNKEDFEIIDRVVELAKKKGVSPATLAISWLLHKGVAAPIVGATKMKHLEDAAAAVSVSLSLEELKSLEELYKPHPISGHQ